MINLGEKPALASAITKYPHGLGRIAAMMRWISMVEKGLCWDHNYLGRLSSRAVGYS